LWLDGWPGWLASWLAGWLAGWLDGWVAGWLDGEGPMADAAMFLLLHFGRYLDKISSSELKFGPRFYSSFVLLGRHWGQSVFLFFFWVGVGLGAAIRSEGGGRAARSKLVRRLLVAR